MQVLPGTHISPETAYVVEDYPYGFRLRCKMRYWIEFKSGHGFRCGTQTTNPKWPGEVWNKPKFSTYSKISGALYLDDEQHVQFMGLTEYGDAASAQAFKEKFWEGVTDEGKPMLDAWIKAKLAYEARKATTA